MNTPPPPHPPQPHAPNSRTAPGGAPAPARFRLERWHRWSVYASVAALHLTGLLWLWAHGFLRQATEFGEVVHPLEHRAMQLHGAAAMALLFFVGSLLHTHIRRAHRQGMNRLTGWLMVGLLSVLAGGGYGLYYLVSEDSRNLWSVTHWAVGLGLPVMMAWHIVRGRRRLDASRTGSPGPH